METATHYRITSTIFSGLFRIVRIISKRIRQALWTIVCGGYCFYFI